MDNTSWARRRAISEVGQDLVEFGLLLPLLLLIFFGVIDLGRIMHASIAITNAARVGARYGSMYPDDFDAIIAVVEEETQGSSIDLTELDRRDILVDCPSGCAPGQPIRVEVTYQFELIITTFFVDADLPVFSYAEMMIL
jgi:hypothetical protein